MDTTWMDAACAYRCTAIAVVAVTATDPLATAGLRMYMSPGFSAVALDVCNSHRFPYAWQFRASTQPQPGEQRQPLTMLGSSERRHSHSQGSSRSRSPTRRSRAAAPISVPAGAKRHDDRSRSPIRRLAPPCGGCVAHEGGEGTSNSFVLWPPLLVLSVFYHVPACRSAYSQYERYWSVAAVLGTPNGIR